MCKPVRIQRSRQHKQVSPNGLNIKVCSRPGKWGNPFKLIGDGIYVDASFRKHLGKWAFLCHGTIDDVINLFRIVVTGRVEKLNITLTSRQPFADILYWVNYFSEMDVKELAGYNISCWCKPGEPCHADVLLELANNHI